MIDVLDVYDTIMAFYISGIYNCRLYAVLLELCFAECFMLCYCAV